MAIAFFVLGHAGSGKTTFSKNFIKNRLLKKEPWCLIDKDTVGLTLGTALSKSMGLDVNDRDSPDYMAHIRDLEYQACLDIMKEQLELGINVIAPAPWTKELNEKTIFNHEQLNLPKNTQFVYIYLETNIEKAKERILARNNPKDDWKIKNWDCYSEKLTQPEMISIRNILVLKNNNLTEQLNFIEDFTI